MEVSLSNVLCCVHKVSQQEYTLLNDTLSARFKGYQYTHAYKMGRWDGYHHFFHRATHTFPAGFLPMIIDTWREQELPLAVKDLRDSAFPVGVIPLSKTLSSTLRDYQSAEIQKIFCNSLKIGKEGIPWMRGVLKHPTGSGKSVVAMGIIETVNAPTLYLLERRRLLHQFAEQYSQFTGNPIGKIGDGLFSLERVTIASVPSLVNLLHGEDIQNYLKTIRLVIVDECHHVKKGRYLQIMKHCTNAAIRIGMSGTPLSRGDVGDLELVGATSVLLSTLQRDTLETKGYLSKVKVKFLNCETDSGIVPRETYQEAYKRLIVFNETRNRRIARIAAIEVKKNNARVLILVRLLHHGDILEDYCRDALRGSGMTACFLHGSIDSESQGEAIQEFRREGTLRVIIATSILDEGVDIPEANVLINAASGMSEIRTVQRVGRIVRPKESQDFARVYDFMDRGNKYLLKHSYMRLQTYRGENIECEV